MVLSHRQDYPSIPGPDSGALIVEPDWLHEYLHQPDLRLIDLRDRLSYDDGHVPGACWFDRTSLSSSRQDRSVTLVAERVFANLMRQAGIDANTMVVVYDDVWGMHAARFAWALQRYGHQRVAVLSGGVEQWHAQGYALTRGRVLPFPRSFVAKTNTEYRADMSWLAIHRSDARLLLLDVRGAHEFSESHLAGAQHWDWNNGTPVGSWATLRPLAELRAELLGQGITPDRSIVTYCASGSRAAHTYLLLRSLGYPEVRVLDDAWRQWARSA